MNARSVFSTYECELISSCAFYTKYSKRTSPAWRGFIRQYCFKGNQEAACCRKASMASVAKLDADLMPSGQHVPYFFHELP